MSPQKFREGLVKESTTKIQAGGSLMLAAALIVLSASSHLCAEAVSLQALVTPYTTTVKDGRPVTFALHGFIEFKSLAELFRYIELQTQRWNVPGGLDDEQRRRLAGELLRRGIESRVISMEDVRPLETLVTHTSEELRQALARGDDPVPQGDGDAFLAGEEKRKQSLEFSGAAPSSSRRTALHWGSSEEGIQPPAA